MTTAIHAPQVPGLVKAPSGRAGANITVQDRVRGTFQDLLSQTLEQRLERIEAKMAEGDARPRPGHIGGFATAEAAAQTGAHETAKRLKGRPHFPAAEAHCQFDSPAQTRMDRHALPAADRFLKVHLMGEANLFSKQALQRWQDRHQQTEPMDVTRGHILKGIFVGPRGELLDAKGNLIGSLTKLGKIGPVHPRNPGSAKAMEEIAPVRRRGPEPAFGLTPFGGKAGPPAPTQAEEAAADEALDVTSLWKEYMKRWIEGSKAEEEEKNDDETDDGQADKAAGLKGLKLGRGDRRFVPEQSDQLTELDLSAASVADGIAGEGPRSASPLWREFMRQWMEGLADRKDQAAVRHGF